MSGTHTVKKGETLSGIANRNGIKDWKRIADKRLNPQFHSDKRCKGDPRKLPIGMVLKLPPSDKQITSDVKAANGLVKMADELNVCDAALARGLRDLEIAMADYDKFETSARTAVSLLRTHAGKLPATAGSYPATVAMAKKLVQGQGGKAMKLLNDADVSFWRGNAIVGKHWNSPSRPEADKLVRELTQIVNQIAEDWAMCGQGAADLATALEKIRKKTDWSKLEALALQIAGLGTCATPNAHQAKLADKIAKAIRDEIDRLDAALNGSAAFANSLRTRVYQTRHRRKLNRGLDVHMRKLGKTLLAAHR